MYSGTLAIRRSSPEEIVIGQSFSYPPDASHGKARVRPKVVPLAWCCATQDLAESITIQAAGLDTPSPEWHE